MAYYKKLKCLECGNKETFEKVAVVGFLDCGKEEYDEITEENWDEHVQKNNPNSRYRETYICAKCNSSKVFINKDIPKE